MTLFRKLQLDISKLLVPVLSEPLFIPPSHRKERKQSLQPHTALTTRQNHPHNTPLDKLHVSMLVHRGRYPLPGVETFAYILIPKLWPIFIILVICGTVVVYNVYQYSKELDEVLR
ncbi:hypothetical protein BDZ45DRAFT_730484 [Acephala macrosclerotiorum]|nr:hypothetical protein BDZ45DRAFT_730484 [Acephala macrosclerotiorum]